MLRQMTALAISTACRGGVLAGDVLRRLWLQRPRQECVILYYHGVTDRQAPRFRLQMEWLAKHSQVVPLTTATQGTWTGLRTCLTFDDGLDNVRRNALPVLRELGLPATQFVVSENLGRTPAWPMAEGHPDRSQMLSSGAQLREYGPLVEIGSHTRSHCDLSQLGEAALRRELVESKRRLEDQLGRTITSLSVPFGAYNERTLRAAVEARYRVVVTCDPRVMRPCQSMIGAGRFKVTPDDPPLEFKLKANGAERWRGLWQQIRRMPASGRGTAVAPEETWEAACGV